MERHSQLRDPKSIEDAINFAQISRNIKLHRTIPTTGTDYRTNYRKLTQGKNMNFTLRTITIGQLKHEIKHMKRTNSAGIDIIFTKTLKKIIKPLYSPLLNQINKCIATATYPEMMKTAQIVPLLKKGKPDTEALSILPSIGKIIDIIINTQIGRHLDSNNMFYTNTKGQSEEDQT